jgi:integrase
MRHKFTDKYLQNLKPNPDRRIEVRDELLTGFSVRVMPSGKKTFCLMRRLNGKSKRWKIGEYGVFSLAQARSQAKEIIYKIETGQLEVATELDLKPCPTLEQIIPDYIEKHAKVHNRDWRRKAAHLRKFKPIYGKRLDTITRRDVVDVLDRLAKQAPVGANRALAHIRHLMNWCVDRGYIEVSHVNGIKALSKEKARERVLSDDELANLWKACDRLAYPFGPCIRLLILTGQRRAEVSGIRWSEIDLGRKMWVLPSGRAKNGQSHEVPLTDYAIELLQALPRFQGSDLVFTTNGRTPISGYGRLKQRLDNMLPDGQAPWVLHDLRRTFSTNLAKLGIPQPVTEALLNHRSGVVSGVAAIYNRHQYVEEKREALEKLDEMVRSILV